MSQLSVDAAFQVVSTVYWNGPNVCMYSLVCSFPLALSVRDFAASLPLPPSSCFAFAFAAACLPFDLLHHSTRKRERSQGDSKQQTPPIPPQNQSSSLPPPRAAICIPSVWANLRTAVTKQQQQPHSWSAAVSSEPHWIAYCSMWFIAETRLHALLLRRPLPSFHVVAPFTVLSISHHRRPAPSESSRSSS